MRQQGKDTTALRALSYAWPLAVLVYGPLLVFGALLYRLGGATPWISYVAMRRLYCITRGRSNRWLGSLLRRPAARPATPGGLLGALDDSGYAERVRGLEANGFEVLGHLLSDADCDSLVALALATPANLIPAQAGAESALFDPGAPRAVKYDIPEEALVGHPVVRRLLMDASLRELAARYLRCEPINDLIAMWWTSARPGPASSEAAQLYHFDMDRPQFLKIFFYLTDVDTDSGPHCYIRGSHRERPAPLWRDGRHTDAAVLAQYGADREVEITGPRGTAIAVDTSGFHKGKPPRRGARLMLQLEYTSALFGQRYQTLTLRSGGGWEAERREHARYLTRFSVRPEPSP
jgi:hypothetical protein